jgi:murein L,D-transpeptidase YafK
MELGIREEVGFSGASAGFGASGASVRKIEVRSVNEAVGIDEDKTCMDHVHEFSIRRVQPLGWWQVLQVRYSTRRIQSRDPGNTFYVPANHV